MQHQILMFPRLGMEFDGNSIRFGQTRDEVDGLLGVPESVRNGRCYYCGKELALDFDGEGKLEFIEFLGGPEGNLHPDLYGEDPFDADADELLARLSERNGPDLDDSEAGYSYVLRNLSIGLYREITPEDVQAMVREMSRMDLMAFSRFNLEKEQCRAHRWATIGIGKRNYYA